MKYFSKSFYGVLCLLLCGLLTSQPSWAQLEGQNWYMGNQVGVSFASGAPIALTNSMMTTYEGCATLSDKNGMLLAYTNGENIWDRTHQVMPNGSSGLGGHNSASQAAVLLPAPNNLQLVYLFCVDAIDNNLVGGLRYSTIDLTARGGLGDVTATKGVVLPTPTVGGKVTEKLTAVRHANGRDYWIVVHGWQSNAFYSFLLSPSGISTVPVVSTIGSIHQGGGSFFGAGNAVGCMKASPDGHHLALAQRDNLSELFDFDNATGGVSNYVSLGMLPYNYGVEFSPDNSRLYISLILAGQLMQFNLLAGSAAAIQASARLVGTGARSGALQRGPDNKIYIATYNNIYMDAINNPNALGTACGYQANAVLLGPFGQNGLPNMPNAFALNDNVAPTAAFTAATGCAGSAVAFAGTTTPTLSGAVATWNFGDPASGSANVATGPTPTHTYATAGTYQVTLTVTHASLATPLTVTQAVAVYPLPTVRLAVDTLVCPSAVWTLRTNPQPTGTLYRWQDGSTGTTYVAHGPGQYSVEVRATATGCSATASLRASVIDCPVFIPNIITPNGDSQNEFFILKGLTASDWHLRIFDRWGRQVYNQLRYDNHWNATGQGDGLYYYLLENTASGERHQGWIEVVRGS